MDTIKMSNFLSMIKEDALRIGDESNTSFTIERFLAALTDWLMSHTLPLSAEFIQADSLISAHFGGNLMVACRVLSEYVEQNGIRLSDEQYAKRILQESAEEAERQNMDVLKIPVLLNCIFSNPSSAIKKAIACSEGKSIRSKMDLCTLVSEMEHLRKELKAGMLGQKDAIELFVTGFFQVRLGELIKKQKRGPRATFLFTGPSGVGKKLMAERFAKVLKVPYMCFDMAAHTDKDVLGLSGSGMEYISSVNGNVTGFVNKNPECVLVFDGIEKAHPNVLRLLLQILNEGSLCDGAGNTVSFSKVLIILTTDAGETSDDTLQAVICSRVESGNVVAFQSLEEEHLKEIMRQEMQQNTEVLKKHLGIECEIEDNVYTVLLFEEGPCFDAKTVRSRVEKFFLDVLYGSIFRLFSEQGNTGIISVKEIIISLNLKLASDDVKAVFRDESRAEEFFREKENKRISYNIAQVPTEDGTRVNIYLFHLKIE